MRKWQDLAAPDDPGSWYAVRNMIPTRRGTYQLGYGSTGTNYAAASASQVAYAFAARLPNGSSREYVVDGSHIWEWNGSAMTDRTGAISVVGGTPMMAQFGTQTIAALGTSLPTVSSTGGNFAALAGAPQGAIVCVHANAVLIFNSNTSQDSWHASDVGDPSNWSTGESASGRIYEISGPITDAISYGGHVYVFKPSAIFRMTYVGGVVKWAVQLMWRGLGVGSNLRHTAVATKRGIAFIGNTSQFLATDENYKLYLFDGASEPERLNPLTTIGTSVGETYSLQYNPIDDLLVVSPAVGSDQNGNAGVNTSLYYYYSFESGMWGCGVGGASEYLAGGFGTLQGEWGAYSGLANYAGPKPIYWSFITAGFLTRNNPSRPSLCYLQTSKVGQADRKTTFIRCTPLLRRRTSLGANLASLGLELFREREDTTAQSTRSVTESTARKRFDLLGGAATDTYARLYVGWSNLDVEVDDFLIESKDAGRE